jgi:hypothetical protein
MNNYERSKIAQAVNQSGRHNTIVNVGVDTVDQDVCTYTRYIESLGCEIDGTAEIVGEPSSLSYEIWGLTEDGAFRVTIK